MVAAVTRIIHRCGGATSAQFATDADLQDIAVRQLEVVGEAVRHLSTEFCAEHAEIPWQKMIAVRNRIAHGYYDVDYQIMWDIISQELPPLLPKLKAILSSLDS